MSKYPATFMGALFALFGQLVSQMSWLPMLLAMSVVELLPASAQQPVQGILLLSVLFMMTTAVYFWTLTRDKYTGMDSRGIRLFIYFVLQLFILHPLNVLFWASQHYEAAKDGPILGSPENFFLSSFAFFLIGLLVDVVWNKRRSNG